MENAQTDNSAACGQSRSTVGLGAPLFEYAGRMYVRPCERGTILEDRPSGEGLEEILCEGRYIVQILVWEAPNAKVSGAGTASAGLPGWQANGETE